MSFLNNFNKWRNFNYPKYFFSIKPKQLAIGLTHSGGRNHSGKITTYYRGGGHKRKYRIIDFSRDYLFFWNIPAVVISIEYDPNRSCHLALLLYANGFLSYMLATEHLKVGNIVCTNASSDYLEGDRVPTSVLEFGTKINNIRYWSRSAGCYSKYLGTLGSRYCIISLPSGIKKLMIKDNLVTIGVLGNNLYYTWEKYKAGQNRWLGIRPHVRGVAKNPIDHPMGGGQGKTSGGRVSVTPWGIYTKGFKTKRKLFHKKLKNKLVI